MFFTTFYSRHALVRYYLSLTPFLFLRDRPDARMQRQRTSCLLYLQALWAEGGGKVLRPPVEEESLRTGGRKSSKRKKAAGEKLKEDATEEVEEEGGLAEAKTEMKSTRRASQTMRKGVQHPTDGAKLFGEVEREAEERGLLLDDVDGLEVGMDCETGDEEAGGVS